METGLAVVKSGFEDGPIEIRNKKQINICFVVAYYFHFESFQRKYEFLSKCYSRGAERLDCFFSHGEQI